MYKLNKKQAIVVITIIMIIGVIIYYIYINNDSKNMIQNEEFLIENNEIQNTDRTEENIFVHISGAVNNEGVIELENNSRIKDAIENAGGLKENADISNINLASILEDGVKIYIPTIEENEEEVNNAKNECNYNDNYININTATQTELESLPGIGPSTALKIINYRKENGKFSNIEDIKKVSGIGESKFNSIKDLIKVK